MTDNTPFSYKANKNKKTVVEGAEDDIDELPGSYFTKYAAILFDEIKNVKAGVLPPSKSFDLIETLGEGFHSK